MVIAGKRGPRRHCLLLPLSLLHAESKPSWPLTDVGSPRRMNASSAGGMVRAKPARWRSTSTATRSLTSTRSTWRRGR